MAFALPDGTHASGGGPIALPYITNRCLHIDRPPTAFSIFLSSLKGTVTHKRHQRFKQKSTVFRMDLLKLKFRSLNDDIRRPFVEKAESLKIASQALRKERLALWKRGVRNFAVIVSVPAESSTLAPHASSHTDTSMPVESEGHDAEASCMWLKLDCACASPAASPSDATEQQPAGRSPEATPAATLVFTDTASGVQQTFAVDTTKPLGSGSYGQCYIVRDVVSGQCMCAKLANPGHGVEDARASLRKEMAAMNRMTHPNVARAFALCFASDGSLSAMLLPLEAGNLRTWIEALPPLPPLPDASVLAERCVSWSERSCLVQIANGLAHMHGRAVIHLDVKPENVLMRIVGENPLPVLADFGMCRCTEACDGIPDEDLRAHFINSTCYRPIELCTCANLLTRARPRHDVWAFGCIMFETVARSHPCWRRKSGDSLLRLFSGINMRQPAEALYRMRNYRLKEYAGRSMLPVILLSQPQSTNRGEQTSAKRLGTVLAALRIASDVAV